MQKINTISVLIIAQNAQKTLDRTLMSLVNFEEVIVIDGGSTDNTENITNKYNAKFIYNKFEGFSKQRNFAIKQASKKWILFLDSDEELTSELALELYRISVSENPKVLYKIARTEYILKKEIIYGHGKTGYQERFFQKDFVEYKGDIHEYPTINDKKVNECEHEVGEISFNYRINHNPEVYTAQMLKKAAIYSELKANEYFSSGKITNSKTVVFFTFIFYFIKIWLKSYKDGDRGFIASIMEANYRLNVKLLLFEKHIIKKENL